ncbi:RNA polymerase I-specific transcription initiation factor RRN3 [Geopyxis carbonaria]|nr:RNA polymerase I-specific transcription initiation factor RRN3 [Geopyxis carbonaria]
MMSARPASIATLPGLSSAVGGRKHKRDDSETPSEGSSRSRNKTKRVRFAETPPIEKKPLVETKNEAAVSNGKKKRASTLNTSVLFKKFVENALDEKAAGKNIHYEELRRKFQINPAEEDLAGREIPSSNELQMTLTALTNVVSRLDNTCSTLVKDIVNARWVGRDDMFVNTYVRFLGNLVSAQSNYMGIVSKMLVSNLSFLPRNTGRIPGYPIVERSQIYDRVHYALQFILDLVPTAATATLFPALIAEFPHRSERKLEHTRYLANVLRVIEYVPSLRHRLLAVITDRVIKIDIEIQVDLEELDEEEGEELEAELIEGSTNSKIALAIEEETEDESEEGEEADESAPPDTIKIVKETVDKLDSMLALLFNYFSSSFPTDAKFTNDPPHNAIATFEMMHNFFNTTILPTHRSRYTQFLIFWAAQKSPRFSDQLCVSLYEKATDNTRPVRARQAAASYLASYVARAKFMPTNDIRTVVRILCRWLAEFVDKRSAECTGPDVNRWAGFYAISQAVMYIFCFRFRDLREIDEDDDEDDFLAQQNAKWTAGLEVMNKVITSRFNPLKVCSPSVVDMFAKIAHHLQFLFCFSIIEQNKRRGIRREEEGMDAYFPFDPYELKKSKGWINDIYIAWQPVEGLDDDDDAASSDSSDEEDDDMNEENDVEDEDDESDPNL